MFLVSLSPRLAKHWCSCSSVEVRGAGPRVRQRPSEPVPVPFFTILLFPPGLNPLRLCLLSPSLWLVFSAGTRQAQQRAQSLGLKVRGETFGPIRVAGNSREDWHPSPL